MSTAYEHPSFTLSEVLSESNRIIKAHSHHFLALSVLFILPLSVSPIFIQILQSQSISFNLLFSFSCNVLSFIAISTITYSTFLGFNSKPVKFVSSIKSAFYSFLPLLSTFIIYQIIIIFIFLFFALVALSLCLPFLGLNIDDMQSNEYYLKRFLLLFGIVVMMILLWLQVNWSLWTVIVVVESKWGYEPLRRSRYLVTGMRRVSLSLGLLYSPASVFLAWSSYISVQKAGHATGWLSWPFVLPIVLNSVFITMFILHSFAANAVLYMYCKAFHGELDLEIADEIDREYVSLAFDYEKTVQV